jgi:hypothetical protein
MYKNTLRVDYDISKLNKIAVEVSWQEQSMFTELMIKYIPNHIIRTVPEDDRISIEWDSEDSFTNFLNEDLYIAVLKVISRYDISVRWS